MHKSLKRDLDSLDALLPQLEKRRSFSPLAKDIFEACAYWSKLGHLALQNDTRVIYPARAAGEMPLLEKLQTMLGEQREDDQSFCDALANGKAVLSALQDLKPPKEGHFGTLRIIQREFAFLISDYAFRIMREEPTGIFFSSGAVYVNLEYATTPDLSCGFGPESPRKTFWIDDLLYMMHDSRYRTVPRELNLDTEAKVEEWFGFLTGVFKRYGRDVLANRPGIFEEIEQAQLQRDREYTQEMDARYGSHR